MTTSSASPNYASGGSVPVPDPTERTTENLLRELASLREIMLARIEGQRDVFDARISGMDKAITLLQTITDRQPADVDKKVANLERLHQEKFSSIQVQFQERDVRTEQTSRDSKVAVDAALQAAKEAVGEQNKSSALAIAKSEAATAKQIDQQSLLISSTNAGVNDKIDDIKERLTRIEGTGKGRSDVWGYVIGAAGVVIGILAVLSRFGGHS